MRLIDADALIDDIRKNSESYFADDFAHEWVDKQPTIEIPTWIPVSERLPEDFGYVLTSCGDGDVFFEWYDGIGSFPADVIAWMPLPKPYEVPDAD